MPETKVPCEVFSRVVGYIRPARIGKDIGWNPGKDREWQDRKAYNLDKIPEEQCDK